MEEEINTIGNNLESSLRKDFEILKGDIIRHSQK